MAFDHYRRKIILQLKFRSQLKGEPARYPTPRQGEAVERDVIVGQRPEDFRVDLDIEAAAPLGEDPIGVHGVRRMKNERRRLAPKSGAAVVLPVPAF